MKNFAPFKGDRPVQASGEPLLGSMSSGLQLWRLIAIVMLAIAAGTVIGNVAATLYLAH